MSVKYVPVQWNPNKHRYDLALVAAVALYLLLFLNVAPMLLDHPRPINAQILNARAFGSCAFFMMTAILMIGPLARLDRRFLPLLYNRRHFGVLTLFVALTHAGFVYDWYFAFSPSPKAEALLFANTSYDSALGFPFEAFGIFALLSLAILATTSHDFWMSFLTPRIWKGLHYLIYPAYGAVALHIALGAAQDEGNQIFALIASACAGTVAVLHVAAALRERGADGAMLSGGAWVHTGVDPRAIEDGFARIIRLAGGARVAIFRQGETVSAISNACAHQNGPLGEGRIVDGCVTCPWHGFQYRVADGRSPAPFTEKVPTYNIRVAGGEVLIDPVANPPGTPVTPAPIGEAAS